MLIGVLAAKGVPLVFVKYHLMFVPVAVKFETVGFDAVQNN